MLNLSLLLRIFILLLVKGVVDKFFVLVCTVGFVDLFCVYMVSRSLCLSVASISSLFGLLFKKQFLNFLSHI